MNTKTGLDRSGGSHRRVAAPIELADDQLRRVSGGAHLGPGGLEATTALEVEAVLSGRNGPVMVIVDGVVMNKDELGMI